MLKKKILGAKVLDTNGYVQATRLITPAQYNGPLQLGDIYNARAVDNLIDLVVKNGGVSELKLTQKIEEAVSNHEIDTSIIEKKVDSVLSDHVKDIDDIKNAMDTMSISGSYNKDSNKLSISITLNGTTLTADIDLSEMLDSNDIIDSDTDTVSREDGKTSINTNIIDRQELNDMINSELK